MAKRCGTRIETIAAMDMETFKPMFGFGRQHFGAIAKAMGVRFPSQRTNTFIGPLPANATEVAVLTTPPLTIPLDFADVFILWMAILTPGTSTTSLRYTLRRGSGIGGAQVGTSAAAFTTVAGNFTTVSGVYFDTPGAVAGQQYTLTCVQVAATVAGVWNDGALIAFSL